MSTKTLADFERGQRAPYYRTLADIQSALERAGLEFTNGGQPGVRMTRVGVLYQMASQLQLDGILDLKGLTGTASKQVEAARTPWSIVKTHEGIDCVDRDGVLLGFVRVGESGLIFSPQMDEQPYRDMTDMIKLRNWLGVTYAARAGR